MILPVSFSLLSFLLSDTPTAVSGVVACLQVNMENGTAFRVFVAYMMLNLARRVNSWTTLGKSCLFAPLSLTINSGTTRTKSFHSSTACHLNRFLFSSNELDDGESSNPNSAVVTIPKDDYRVIHAAKILGLHNGDTVRAGIVSSEKHDGLLTDQAVIEWIPEGKVKKAEPLAKSGDPPGSLRIHMQQLEPAKYKIAAPAVSLILALPRPLQLGRMLPMISQMGVEHLVLTESRKVPKDYFGSHLFRKPDLLTERLVEGLCQAGDVRLPKLHIVCHLSNFLNDDLDNLFPLDQYARVIAHPQRLENGDKLDWKKMRHASFTCKPARIVIAVGPEGGWEEPEELERFTARHEFEQITMGTRVLRSDCAVVSLLALAHDACDQYDLRTSQLSQ